MSKLSELMGKPQTFKVGSIELVIKPLTLDEIDLIGFDQNVSGEIQMKQMGKLVKYCLKKAVPEATDEEISGLALEYLPEIQEAILAVNKLNAPKLQNVARQTKK